MVLMKSLKVIFGKGWLSGACRPNSFTGFRRITHNTIAYSAQTPSCIVDTVMVRPACLPPAAFNAPELYCLETFDAVQS